MAKDFTSLAVTIAVAVIGLVVLTSVFSNLYPSVTTALTNLSHTGYTRNASGSWLLTGTPLALNSLVTGTLIPLVLVAVFILVIVIGLLSQIGKGKSR